MAVGSRGMAVCARWTVATALLRSPLLCQASQIVCTRRYAAWEESVEVDPDGSASRKLTQALKEFRLQKAAPAWLPLIPGSSYWVPPEEYDQVESDDESEDEEDAHVIVWPETTFRPSNQAELYSLMTPMGWPAGDLMSSEDATEQDNSDTIIVITSLGE